MERWRSFFNKAGEDLWTIIEQAILLAAHDYPTEFKEKRCDIAETLFTSRPHQAHGDADVPRLSASVVTNCTNLRMDADETRGEDEHLSAHTEEHTVHDAEQRHSELRSAEARNNKVDDNDASISQIICNIKETLAGSMQSDAALLHGLQTLESLHISVDVLKATEIGKQVNNLRKHSCKEIRLLAKSLVRHWKELVDDWVHRARASLQEGHTASERDNDEGTLSPSHGNNSAQFLTRVRGEMPQYCYDDTKAGDNYLEAPEERGSSSRAEIPGLARIEKPQFNGRDAAAGKEVLEYESNVGAGRLRGVQDSHGTLGFGRPASSDIIAGNGTESSRSYGTGKLSTEGSYLNKLQGDYSSQKHKQSRLPTLNQQKSLCNEGVCSEEKLQASKRKSQEAHTQVDHAKRQQTALPLNNLKDFPTTGGGGARAKTATSGLAPLNSHWK